MGPFATHRFLTRLALSSAHVFAWLFVFQYFFVATGSVVGSIGGAALAYALAHAISVLLTPFAARRLRHGVRGLLINALLSLSVAFAVLAAAFSGLIGSLGLGVAMFAVCMGVYRALYWVPYEVAAKKSSESAYLEFFFACVPAVAGVYMSTTSFAPIMVLALASATALLAAVPLLRIKNSQEGFGWSFRQTFHQLFERERRLPLLQAVLNGFEGAALLLLWPIIIFVSLNWSYSTLGMVFSATLLIGLLARYALGAEHEKMHVPPLQAAVTVSGWVLRGTVAAPIAIVLVDSYYHAGSGSATRGINLVTSEQAADGNSYIDEFTALKDMGQGIGRIVFCLVLAAFASAASFSVLVVGMFGLAGCAAVLSIVLAGRAHKPAF